MARSNLNKITDIDKLLEIANTPKVRKVKPPKTNPEIDNFITECNIVAGKQRIPSYIVYYRYVLHKKIRLMPRLKFLKYFKTKFEKTRTVDGIGYLLSPKGFDLSPQFFFKARAFLRNEKDEAKKDQNSQK